MDKAKHLYDGILEELDKQIGKGGLELLIQIGNSTLKDIQYQTKPSDPCMQLLLGQRLIEITPSSTPPLLNLYLSKEGIALYCQLIHEDFSHN